MKLNGPVSLPTARICHEVTRLGHVKKSGSADIIAVETGAGVDNFIYQITFTGFKISKIENAPPL